MKKLLLLVCVIFVVGCSEPYRLDRPSHIIEKSEFGSDYRYLVKGLNWRGHVTYSYFILDRDFADVGDEFWLDRMQIVVQRAESPADGND